MEGDCIIWSYFGETGDKGKTCGHLSLKEKGKVF